MSPDIVKLKEKEAVDWDRFDELWASDEVIISVGLKYKETHKDIS